MNSNKKNFIPVSLFQLFSIGIGPSSSHTVGPMRAAYQFISILQNLGELEKVNRICIELYGSLAMTGHGHATDIAILLGLIGEKPELIDPDTVSLKIEKIRKDGALKLLDCHPISFSMDRDLMFLKGKRLPFHSNAMKCKAFNDQDDEIYSKIFYSVGGGFVVEHEEVFSPNPEVAKLL